MPATPISPARSSKFALTLLWTLCCAACASKEAVPTVELVRPDPPAELMVPCPREPQEPARTAGQQARALWVSAVINAGDKCRQNSDALQTFNGKATAR